MFAPRLHRSTARAAIAASILSLVACAPDQGTIHIGDFGGGKADFLELEVGIPTIGRRLNYTTPRPGDVRRDIVQFTVSGSGPFSVQLIPGDSQTRGRLVLHRGDQYITKTSTLNAPQIKHEPAQSGQATYTITVWNRRSTRDIAGARLQIKSLANAKPPQKEGGLQYKSYNLLFTNPKCTGAKYDSPIPTADGKGSRSQKPDNVWCQSSQGVHPKSPQTRLVSWITPLGAGDEIFMAYLSFSNSAVARALCEATKRGVKVTLVWAGRPSYGDKTELLTDPSKCRSSNFRAIERGQEGGIGYAHNKVFIVNPKGSSEYMKMVFSSGNMSSGAVRHHENWHFIEVKRQSYFAQQHAKCLVEGQTNDAYARSAKNYVTWMKSCRRSLTDDLGLQEENDIKAFFIPSLEDHKRLRLRMARAIDKAKAIDIAAHRFGSPYRGFTDGGKTYASYQSALRSRLRAGNIKMRMVADDDIYWLMPWGSNGAFSGTSAGSMGDNMMFEAANVASLWRAGGEDINAFDIRFLETNHSWGGNRRKHYLHHNKIMVFRGVPGEADAMLCGAANLTGTGYGSSSTPNFENLYWITIPEVVAQANAQFARFWGERQPGDTHGPATATKPGDMPATLPPMDRAN